MSQKYRIIRHEKLQSTQTTLKELIASESMTSSFTVVMADTQYSGKGRGVSVWQDEPGHSALLSVYVVWPYPVHESFLINQWVCHVLATILPKEVSFKWPNDLMVHDKKLGGLLIENRWEGNRIASSIIGLGINVRSSKKILPRAISLEDIGLMISPVEVVNEVSRAFSTSVHWIANPMLLGRRYTMLLWGRDAYQQYRTKEGEPIVAMVKGVTNEGKLILKTKKGQTHVFDLDDIRWESPY